MRSVIISKSPSVVVKASEPATNEGDFIKLSSYDKPHVGLPVTTFLVFDQQIDNPAETIKRGLSQALLYYYPVSGRLAAGATDGEVLVQCNGEGVSFVMASANCALNDVQELHDPSLQEELAIFYTRRGVGLHTDPLLLMQVTVFSCGGFVVGLTWEHSLADGTGMGQFLQAVGELCRGLPSPNIIPSRSDETLIGVPKTILRISTVLCSLRPSPLVLLDIRVPSSLINRIRRDFSIGGAQTCSVFEAVTAVLWQCRSRAVMEDPNAPTMLLFVANARKYAGAKDGYYGNCLTAPQVITTCSFVANGDTMDVIKMIKHAKDQIPGQFTNEEHGELQESDAKGLVGYNVFCVTSWRNIGVEKADFGGGRPARVMAYTKNRTSFPLCLSCLPWNDNEYFSVMTLCVKEEHAEAFLRELASFT